MGSAKFIEMIWSTGFKDDFSVVPGSVADKVIKERVLAHGLQEFLEESEPRINDCITLAKEDEISYRVLLRHAQISKRRARMKSNENPWGFVFSEEDHEKIAQDALEAHNKRGDISMREAALANAVAMRLKKGTFYNSRRRFEQHLGTYEDITQYFNTMINLRNLKSKRPFNIAADIQLLRREHDVTKSGISELSNGLTEKDLRYAVRERLFHRAAYSFMDRKALFLAKYKKGLQKLLAQPQNESHS